MKYRVVSILWMLSLLFSLASCGEETEESATVSFYYRISDELAYDDNQLIQPEQRTLSTDEEDLESLLQLYLEGPLDAKYTSPFPKGTNVVRVRQVGTSVQVVLSEGFSQLTGINRTIADACLTLTLTSLEGVESVTIYVVGENTEAVAEEPRTMEDYILVDEGIEDQTESIKLYFADSANRYLMGDQRSVVVSENEAVSVYIMQQLIAGPTDDQLQATIPEGTQLLSVTQDGDLCIVDLSAEFRENMPKTEQGERMTVYSIVNSLTELETIARVQILCEGQTIGIYRYLDLSEPFVRNEDVIGPVLSGLNEFDATIYMQSWSSDYLAEVPLRIHQTANQSQEELVIEALISYEPVNGFTNPIPAGTRLLSEDMTNGICRVTLSHEFAEDAHTVSEQRMRVIALVASLTALDNVEAVLLTVEGLEENFFGDFDLSSAIYRSEDWFFP